MTLTKWIPHEDLTILLLPIRLGTTGLALLVITFIGNVPHAQAELLPTQVMIVANANSRESLRLRHITQPDEESRCNRLPDWIFRWTRP